MHRSRLPIAQPCGESWSDMRRLGRAEKHCSRCGQTVVNLSALTRAQAERFLARRSGQCIRYGYSPSNDQISFRSALPAPACSAAALGTFLSLAACAPGEPLSKVDAALAAMEASPGASRPAPRVAPRAASPGLADERVSGTGPAPAATPTRTPKASQPLTSPPSTSSPAAGLRSTRPPPRLGDPPRDRGDLVFTMGL